MDRPSAISALERARELDPSVEGLLDLALAYQLAGDLGGEVSASEAATRLDSASLVAWSRYAHALARTDRIGECVRACERALALGPDVEVELLLERLRGIDPKSLPGAGITELARTAA
jgi:tetratricopeptide (TPR) repeat protein